VNGFNSQFPTLQDFYNYLASIGVTYTDCNAMLIKNIKDNAKKRKVYEAPIIRRAPRKNSPETEKLYNEQLEKSRKIKREQSQQKSSTNIEFDINPVALATISGQKYNFFTITAK
jgi:hypothetical protein